MTSKTVIQQRVQVWFEIMQNISQYKLKPEEQTIIEFLRDYWRNYSDVGDDDGLCQSYLEELKTFKNHHPENPEIGSLCNQLRLLAEKTLLSDDEDYHTFQQLAREYVKQHKPKPQQPQSKPQAQQSTPNRTIIQAKLQEWFEAMQELSTVELLPEESDIIEWLWKYPNKYSNVGDDKGECRARIDRLKDFKNKHPKNPEVVTLCNQLRGIAEKMFLQDNNTYHTFQQLAREYIAQDSFRGLSPQDLRINREASLEFEEELLSLLGEPEMTEDKPTSTVTQQSSSVPKPAVPKPTTRKPTSYTPPPPTYTTSIPKKTGGSNINWTRLVFLVVIALVLYFGGWNWIKGLFSDGGHQDNRASAYVLVESLNMRADASTNSNVLCTLGYGQQVYLGAVSQQNWLAVSVDGQNGFVDSTYIGTIEELQALQYVWGGDGTRNTVTDVRHRRALIEYIKDSKTLNDFQKDGGYKLHASGNNAGNVWSHKSLGGNGVFAFILEKGKGGRVAIVCAFNEKDEPHVTSISDNVEAKQYIKKVTYRKGKYNIVFGGGKGKDKDKNTHGPKHKQEPEPEPESGEEQTTSQGFHFEKEQTTSPGYHFEPIE